MTGHAANQQISAILILVTLPDGTTTLPASRNIFNE